MDESEGGSAGGCLEGMVRKGSAVIEGVPVERERVSGRELSWCNRARGRGEVSDRKGVL